MYDLFAIAKFLLLFVFSQDSIYIGTPTDILLSSQSLFMRCGKVAFEPLRTYVPFAIDYATLCLGGAKKYLLRSFAINSSTVLDIFVIFYVTIERS